MIQEILKAFMFIFVAEMGDKTQILAMAFATKFPLKKVLLGILIGSFLNHALAVYFGSLLSNFIPVNALQVVAGFAFVGFALWTLIDEDEDEEEKTGIRFGPVVTVSLAFFLGELGDKTQLAAITLSTEAVYPLAILCGTVSGMVFTGSIGIFVGRKLGEKIPDFIIKLVAASVFMFFGLLKLFQTLPPDYMTLTNIALFLTALGLVVFFILRSLFIKRKQRQVSPLKKQSAELFHYYQTIQNKFVELCLGTNQCGKCQGEQCILGYLKRLIRKDARDLHEMPDSSAVVDPETLGKQFDRTQLKQCLKLTEEVLAKQQDSVQKEKLQNIKENLEKALNKQPQEQSLK